MNNISKLLLFLFVTTSVFADSYFVRLTKPGMVQRSHLLSGQYNQILGITKPNQVLTFRALSHHHYFQNWITIQADSTQLHSFITDMQQAGLADFAEPVGHFKINGMSADSLFERQWYLNKLDILSAWQRTKGKNSVIVGVIDTGVDYTHPDLQGSLWQNTAELDGLTGTDDDGNGYVDDTIGWDFTDAPKFADGGDYLDEDNDPMDEFGHGHGTQIAGLIAAQVNELGIAGIAPDVRVMVLRAGTASGYLEEDDVARAILYAVDNGARILNMSFGDLALSQLLRDVIHFAYERGMVMVASAGNSGSNEIHYPAGLQETISVGASTINDYLAGFSNYGSMVDLTAPGDSIISTALGGDYNVVNGTSFSAPMVAAVGGLILSQQSTFSPQRVRNILKTSTDDIMYKGWDLYSGAGRLNAEKALAVQDGGILEIINPAVNFSTAADSLWILGTILHPDILSAELAFGIGNAPDNWTSLVTFERRQVYKDTLGFINLKNLPDTLLQIRLSMSLINGNTDQLQRLMHIDRSEPIISDVQLLPMFDGVDRAGLISFTTDDLCRAKIFLRPCGTQDFSISVNFAYESKNQIIKLPVNEYSGCYEFYLQAVNNSGLSTEDNNSGQYFSFDLDFGADWTDFAVLPWDLPGGYLLDKSMDLNHNGQKEILISRYSDDFAYGPVEVYEFSQGQFLKSLETGFTAIPRDIGDADGDGKAEMLLGYGQHSFLFESVSPTSYPDQLIWMDTTNFWAAGFANLDGDVHNEIIGRQDSVYLVLENTADNAYKQIAALSNKSSGENSYGVPLIRQADFDADGTSELLFGDYDGDVLIFSGSQDNQFELFAQLSATQQDATGMLAVDSNHLFVASHTENEAYYEHEADGRYWSIDWFTYNKNTMSFELNETLHFAGYKNQKDFDSGIQAATIEGKQYLFAALFPNFYVFRIDEQGIRLTWFQNNARSNAILISDFDRDGRQEFYYNTGERIIGYTTGEIDQPAYPFSFHADALDSNRIQLRWNSVEGAQAYQIYRGTEVDALGPLTMVYDQTFIDTDLITEQYYYFAVAAIDSNFIIPQSPLSVIDSARTSTPPKLIRAIPINSRQLQLQFDEEVSFKDDKTVSVVLKRQQQKASSVVLMPGRQKILCSFSTAFTDGQTDTVKIQHIFDLFGVPVDQHHSQLSFLFTRESDQPYLKKLQVLNRTLVRLYFSQSMDAQALTDIENYILNPSGQVEKAVEIDSTFSSVELQLSANSLAGAFGHPAYLELQNITSKEGILLKETAKINLYVEEYNLDNLIIYPQPVKPNHELLIFAKLPQNVEVSVFNLNGSRIWQQNGQTYFGGLHWNLKDLRGERVSSGIYFYEVKYENRRKFGKIVVVR